MCHCTKMCHFPNPHYVMGKLTLLTMPFHCTSCQGPIASIYSLLLLYNIYKIIYVGAMLKGEALFYFLF